MRSVQGKTFILLTSIFCMMLTLTNIIGLKIFSFAGFPLPAAILIYPITFVLSGLVTEIYGKEHARFMIYAGFCLNFACFLLVSLLVKLPPHELWAMSANPFSYTSAEDYQNAYAVTVASQSFSVFASMLAYLCAQLSDVFLFSKIKDRTNGRYLWLRSNVSAAVSQFIDTAIVSIIVLYIGLKMHAEATALMICTTYVAKVFISALATPFVYITIWLVKRKNKAISTYTS